MKTLALICALLFIAPTAETYKFKLKNIDGKEFTLAKFKGKKILVVNTASQCGFTKQYAELQQLQNKYKDKLVIVGFPANNFGGQEPGSDPTIKQFCTQTFGITFPLSTKISVKGDDIDPLFKYLTSAPNPDFTGEIKWNFEKFLLDENGVLIHRFRSQTTPMSEDITKYLN